MYQSQVAKMPTADSQHVLVAVVAVRIATGLDTIRPRWCSTLRGL